MIRFFHPCSDYMCKKVYNFYSAPSFFVSSDEMKDYACMGKLPLDFRSKNYNGMRDKSGIPDATTITNTTARTMDIYLYTPTSVLYADHN